MSFNMNRKKAFNNCVFQSYWFKINEFRKVVWEAGPQKFSEVLDAPLQLDTTI